MSGSTTSPPGPAPAPQGAPVPRPTTKARIPSLNQLAARISSNSVPTSTTNTTTNANRPRLQATLLQRSSVISSNGSDTSLADSTAAQPPSTRAVTPDRSSSPAVSANDGGDTTEDMNEPSNAPGSELTAEHLERFNLTEDSTTASSTISTRPVSNSRPARGYKNVPSLEAITERLRKTRILSIDGTEAPPPVPPPEISSTASAPSKPKEHPLQHTWTLYHDTKAKQAFAGPGPAADPAVPYVPPSTETGAYEANLTTIGEFNTVEEFCRYFNWLKPPSALERNSNYHLFKSGIKPMWEDEANANGGKWVLTMKAQPQLLDRCWSWLAMALVGEELEEGDEICGAVVSLRSKVDRIQLWIRSKDDVERINNIGRKLMKLLDVSDTDGIGLEFQYNTDERPTPQKFLSIQATFPQSGFRSTFSPQTQTGPFAIPRGPAENVIPGLVDSNVGGRNNPFGAGGGGAFGSSTGWRGRR